MRRLLLGNGELLGAEAGNADHPDVAVAPRLRRDPFDQVVAVPFARAAAFRFADAAWRADDMNIAARHKELGIAGLHRAGPQRRPGRLRRQRLAPYPDPESPCCRWRRQAAQEIFRPLRPIDVDANFDAVAHRHHDVHVAGDRRITSARDRSRSRIFGRLQQTDAMSRRSQTSPLARNRLRSVGMLDAPTSSSCARLAFMPRQIRRIIV